LDELDVADHRRGGASAASANAAATSLTLKSNRAIRGASMPSRGALDFTFVGYTTYYGTLQ
jgi:hypothetical protein